jgi:hypothetical protein
MKESDINIEYTQTARAVTFQNKIKMKLTHTPSGIFVEGEGYGKASLKAILMGKLKEETAEWIAHHKMMNPAPRGLRTAPTPMQSNVRFPMATPYGLNGPPKHFNPNDIVHGVDGQGNIVLYIKGWWYDWPVETTNPLPGDEPCLIEQRKMQGPLLPHLPSTQWDWKKMQNDGDIIRFKPVR